MFERAAQDNRIIRGGRRCLLVAMRPGVQREFQVSVPGFNANAQAPKQIACKFGYLPSKIVDSLWQPDLGPIGFRFVEASASVLPCERGRAEASVVGLNP